MKRIVKQIIIWVVAILFAMTFLGCVRQNQNATGIEVQSISESKADNKVETTVETIAETISEANSETTAESKAELADKTKKAVIDENGSYYDVENVVLYLYTYGKLPNNYITKKEAKALGWEGGSVEAVAPDKAIGGDHYGNYEGTLPEVKGRKYYECDIDTHGYKNRGSRRLIYSNDGAYYYTGDHYNSFKELYVTDEGVVQWK